VSPHRVSEDASTIQCFRQRLNGGNVHRGTALLRSYQFAVEYANHRRCPDFRAAVANVARVAEQLRRFA
jgi:hypothetical protein